MRAHVITLAMIVGLTACGGGGAMHAVPQTALSGPRPQQSATVAFRIAVPTKATASTRRSPRYVSTSTQSVTITVAPAGGRVAATATVNCTSVCSGQIAAPVGSDTFTANLYDAQNGAGNLLSTGTITQTVVADQANTVNMTFNGVVSSLAVALSPSIITAGTAATINVVVNGIDASGATIVGPGGYADANGNSLTIALANSDTSGATKLSASSVITPGTAVSLAYNGSPSFSSTTITASAGSITPGKAVLGTGCGSAPNTDLYVATNSNLAAFPLNASGNASPAGTLNVAASSVAFDAQGSAYVVNQNAARGEQVVSVYCAGATGNATPVRTIVFPSGTILEGAIAVDGPGNVYVATVPPGLRTYDPTASILQYAPGAGTSVPVNASTGPTPVTRRITGIVLVGQIAVDSAGNVYGTDLSGVNIYGPGASGNAPAAQHITDARAGLDYPGPTAVDAAGNVYTIYADTNLANDCDPGTSLLCHVVAVTPPGGGTPTHVLRTPSGWDPIFLAVNPAGTVAVFAGQGAKKEILVYPAGSQDGRATPSRTISLSGGAISIAIDAAGNVYLGGFSGSGEDVVVYPAAGTPYSFGNGSQCAVAGDGTAYVRQFISSTVNVYAPGATGSAAPIRTLDTSGAFPGSNITDLALDAQGGIYVRLTGQGQPIAAFAPGASGTATPTRTFTNPFDVPDDAEAVGYMAADASGNVYVVDGAANLVNVYPPSANGTVSPARQILHGSPTTFYASGLAVDAQDTLYVASTFSASIDVYPKGSSTPSRSIFGPNAHLDSVFGTSLAADPAGFIYASSVNGTLVFGPTANGNVAPIRILNDGGALAVGPGP